MSYTDNDVNATHAVIGLDRARQWQLTSEGTTKRENKKWIWHNSHAIVATVRALLTFKNTSK